MKAGTFGTPLDGGGTRACLGLAPEGVSHDFKKTERLTG